MRGSPVTSVRVEPGDELRLAATDWRYGASKTPPQLGLTRALPPGPLWLRVHHVRRDISRHYGEEVWIEGWRLDETTGLPFEEVEALVRVAALHLQT